MRNGLALYSLELLQMSPIVPTVAYLKMLCDTWVQRGYR